MKRKQLNPYFVRSVIAVLLILFAVVCTVIMVTGRESNESEISGTTTMTTAVETINETTVETTIPMETTEYTEPETEPAETDPVEPEVTTTKATEPKPTEPKPTNPPETEPPVTNGPESANNMSDLEMLACVIYQEAGGDAICQDCRYRVGDIVLNRVTDDRFPNDIYSVLTQKNQYGKFYKTGIKWPSRASKPEEAYAVERAYQVAQDILNGNHGELYGKGYVWQAKFTQGNEGFWCCGHFYGR